MHDTDETIIFQMRATSQINKVFNFSECYPGCGCDKDVCFNFLIGRKRIKHYKFLIKRVRKVPVPEHQPDQSEGNAKKEPISITMWGLFALEDIPAGAYLTEYRGEVVTKKQGDMRGKFYDQNGLSYLFDMNDPLETDEKERSI
jgi:hypothetical protein